MSGVEVLISSPALLPVERVGATVHAARLTEADYKAASFLDQRLFADADTVRIDWADLEQAAARLRKRANVIFHIGHVGSTLLARLLGEHHDVFCLREPAVLRPSALAGASTRSGGFTAELDIWLRLLSRTWRPHQRALIKVTSFVSEQADDILSQLPADRGLILGVTPPNYLRVILGGEQSRREIETLAGLRRSRLQARLNVPVAVASEGEWIAMSWLCETLCLHQTMERSSARLLWMDFDRLLSDPVHELSRAFRHLGHVAEPAWVSSLAAGPIMHRYSKGPEHAYDSALRRAVMAQAQEEHATAVQAGMAWLQMMAEQHGLVVETLHRAATAARPIGAPVASR